MPDNDYELRLHNQHVGYLLTELTDKTITKTVPYGDIIHRYNLVTKDPSVRIYQHVKPIT
jgi:hypothetical protein